MRIRKKKNVIKNVLFSAPITLLATTICLSSCKNNDVKIEGIESYTSYLYGYDPQTESYYWRMEIVFCENLKEGNVTANGRSISVDISGAKLISTDGARKDHSANGTIKIITINGSTYKYDYTITFHDAKLVSFVITTM